MKTQVERSTRAETSVDVLVIGGGVIGCSIAYHVALQGQSVLLIERDEIANEPSASWASAGGIRRQGVDPEEALLASAAVERWPTLADELDADIHYQQGGYLLLAESDDEAEQLRASVTRQHDLGFADVRFIERYVAFELVPGLAAQVVAGSFGPDDGQADAILTTRAFADAADRHGTTIWTGTDCLALERSGDRVIGARTSRSIIHAEHVVLANGAWAVDLVRSVGVRLPVRAEVLQMVLSTPATPALLQPVIGAVRRTLSLKQRRDGAFLLGGGWLGDPSPDRRSYTLRESHLRGNWQTAVELLPAVGRQGIKRSWGGLQAATIDDLPYIGSISGLEGLTFVLGSWFGFGLSPAIGASVANHLAGKPTPELNALSPDRLTGLAPGEIDAFVAGNDTTHQ